MRPRRRARGLLGLWLGAMLVAGCGGGAQGHWTDPDARLVDGVWIGSPIACPPVRDECAPNEDSARGGPSDADAARVARITWVSLPHHFVTDEGQTFMPGRHVGIWTWAAALVTLDDGAERVVGMLCMFAYSGGDGRLIAGARCARQPLPGWEDGSVPLAFASGTTHAGSGLPWPCAASSPAQRSWT